jgi:hypothetical protein
MCGWVSWWMGAWVAARKWVGGGRCMGGWMGALIGGGVDGWMNREGMGYKGCTSGDVTVVRPSPCTALKCIARNALPSLRSKRMVF